MRALFAAILILVLGGAIAVGAYDAGLAQGAAQLVVPAAGAAPAGIVVARPWDRPSWYAKAPTTNAMATTTKTLRPFIW